MTMLERHIAALATIAVAAAFALACAPALAAHELSPLPPSDYAVRGMCPAPRPGHASCLALRLVAKTAAARAHTHPLGVARSAASASHGTAEECELAPAAEGCYGLRPQDVHSAYGLPDDAPTAQTIALVDSYNDPTAEADLRAYDEEFGLPECTRANGCFTQVNQRGEAGNLPFPATSAELEAARTSEPEEAEEAEGWSVEISLDIETAHAACQSCKILLVEADSTGEEELEAAEQTAATLGAQEISNSWGGPECVEQAHVRECIGDSSAFADPGIVITAAAGDEGYLGWDGPLPGFAEYPASSPQVVAVGGTRLLLSEAGAWAGESVWNDGGVSAGKHDGHGAGGGGCSVQFAAPPWQQSLPDWSSVGCGSRRAVADVAADADPYTGLAVYDSSSEECAGEEEGEAPWCTIGGTSLASPLVAATFALAGGAHGVEYPARTLYENALDSPGSLHDVSDGSNGQCTKPFDEYTGQSGCTTTEQASNSCSSRLICLAGTGYDGPTGVGTPNGTGAFEPPAGADPGSGATQPASAPSSPAAPGSPPATVSPPMRASVMLSELELTFHALIALNRSRPRIAALAFTFVSNLAARVRVSLQKRVGRRRHAHWRTFTHTRTIRALSGRNEQRLRGRRVLRRGAYRLTLTAADGSASSIVFRIG
jgi:Subtilase family